MDGRDYGDGEQLGACVTAPGTTGWRLRERGEGPETLGRRTDRGARRRWVSRGWSPQGASRDSRRAGPPRPSRVGPEATALRWADWAPLCGACKVDTPVGRPETTAGRSHNLSPAPQNCEGRGVKQGLAPQSPALLRSSTGRMPRTLAPRARCPLNDSSLSLACAGRGEAPSAAGTGWGAADACRRGWNTSGGPTCACSKESGDLDQVAFSPRVSVSSSVKW